MKTFFTVLGIGILAVVIVVFATVAFLSDDEYTKQFSASYEPCRVLHTEFERKHIESFNKRSFVFNDNWKVSVFNINDQKTYFLNFSENPNLVNDSVYKFVVLH